VANKTTKEKFLVDLQREEDFDLLHTPSEVNDATTATNLWGDSNEGIEATAETHASWIVADEFITLLVEGILIFVICLASYGILTASYRDRIKNGRSVTISFSCM